MDIAKLEKEVKILEQRKLQLDGIIENQSKENLRYLDEIPKSKKWAEEQREQAQVIADKTTEVRKELDIRAQELKDLRHTIADETIALENIRKQNSEELKSLVGIREEIKQKTADLKARESALRDRTNLAETQAKDLAKKSEDLDSEYAEAQKVKAELELAKSAIETAKKELSDRQSKFNAALALFEENKKVTFNQEQEIKFRLDEARNVIQKNEQILTESAATKRRVEGELLKLQAKQASLDRSIAELDNDKKKLQIWELKIKKFAHDNNLDKELADLQKETA